MAVLSYPLIRNGGGGGGSGGSGGGYLGPIREEKKCPRHNCGLHLFLRKCSLV